MVANDAVVVVVLEIGGLVLDFLDDDVRLLAVVVLVIRLEGEDSCNVSVSNVSVAVVSRTIVVVVIEVVVVVVESVPVVARGGASYSMWSGFRKYKSVNWFLSRSPNRNDICSTEDTGESPPSTYASLTSRSSSTCQRYSGVQLGKFKRNCVVSSDGLMPVPTMTTLSFSRVHMSVELVVENVRPCARVLRGADVKPNVKV